MGLGGSSAIIKAILAALMKFYGLTEKEIPKPIQPNIILEAETGELVDKAKTLLFGGQKEALGPVLSEDFDLRKSVYNISPANLKIIEIARNAGAHAKQTGSGGAARLNHPHAKKPPGLLPWQKTMHFLTLPII